MALPMPTWLPEMLDVNGDWDAVLARLYAVFDRDFRKTSCLFETRQVFWDKHVVEGKYEEGFWHLITKTDQASGDRLLEPRRAERLPWCKPTLANCRDVAVKMWDYKEGKGRPRTYVWLERCDYVIVLEKRSHKSGEIAFLVTAYFVEGENTRKRLHAKYAARIV